MFTPGDGTVAAIDEKVVLRRTGDRRKAVVTNDIPPVLSDRTDRGLMGCSRKFPHRSFRAVTIR